MEQQIMKNLIFGRHRIKCMKNFRNRIPNPYSLQVADTSLVYYREGEERK